MTAQSMERSADAKLFEQRQRFKLSLLLSNIQSGINEVIGGKTAEEKEGLIDTALDVASKGAHQYVQLVKARIHDADDGPLDRFLLSTHGTSVVDALRLALDGNEDYSQQQKIEFFAGLAQISLDCIKYEAKWSAQEDWAIGVDDPAILVGISVYATQAMDAIHEAKALRQRRGDPITDEHIALKVAEEISKKAKKNAALAHVEHKSYKADVFKWCDENLANYKSFNKAAEAVAGKLVPIAFTTAQSWVREYAKNNPGYRQKSTQPDDQH